MAPSGLANAATAAPPAISRCGSRAEDRAAEPDPGHDEDPDDDRTETVEGSAKNRTDAERCVRRRQGEHDEKPRQGEAEPGQQRAPPASPLVAEEDPELRRGRAWQHVDQGEPFHEPGLRHPLPGFLELRLHHAHDRGTAIGGRADLQEAGRDLLPRSGRYLSHRGGPPCRGRLAVLCRRPQRRRPHPEAASAKANVASGSQERLMSQAEAMRSMCGRGRVTHVLPRGGRDVRWRPPVGRGRVSAARSRLAVVSQSVRARRPAGVSR